jgi:hypothetical protein
MMSNQAKSLIILIAIVFCWFPSNGQYFIWGQDPGSLKWKQIKTDNFQVIFPEGYEEQGAYITSVLELVYEYGSKTLGHKPRPVSVVIHNQTVVSNGFVSWAPRRLEMFSNPPQDNNSHDWLEYLAIHEFRHVVQVDKLNQGITKIMSYIMGEQATGIVFGLFMPMWFAEGDAIAVETGLTNSGRGRLPDFEQGLRAQVLEKGRYSYDKAFFGSFKNHVPNYYELGYQLVAAGRAEYGEDIWDKVVSNVARRPYSLRPFSAGLKKYAGLTTVKHYHQTFEHLDSLWRVQAEQTEYTPIDVISQKNKLFTNYRYPAFINDSTMVALKTGLAEIPQVIALDILGKERVLFRPGIINAHGFSAGAGKVVWSEQRTDPRWEHRSWSEVFIYDIESGKRKQLSRRSRFFAPAISPNGKLIAVAEVTDTNQYALVILSAEDGQEITRLATQNNDFFMTPAWHPDNQTIAAVALNESGKAIITVDIITEKFQQVFHAAYTEISRPVFTAKGQVLFTGAFSGIENIYFLDPLQGSVIQMVSSVFGARDAVMHPNEEVLYWSEYTSGGYVIARNSEPAFAKARPLRQVIDHSIKFHEIINEQEKGLITRYKADSLLKVMEYDQKIEPYYRFPNFFNLHSWSPMYIDANNMEVKPGAAIYFQDVLSTSVAVMGYEYDVNEQTGKFSIDYNYFGFYPVINLNASTGLREGFYRQGDDLKDFLYKENTFRLGLSVPLRFRHYQWFYGLTPITNLAISNVRRTDSSPSFFKPNQMRSLEYRVYAYRQLRSVSRDLRPRWAQIVDLSYRHTPFSGADMGSVFAARLTGFFPGFARHHSLRLSAGWQEQKKGTDVAQTINYRFPNLIAYPRGISGRRDDRVSVISADYSFPLIYPDLSVPPFIYLKRISLNLFLERADTKTLVSPQEGEPYLSKNVFYSTGVDLVGNMHLFRFISPIDLGIRWYYLPHLRADGYQLIFGINF